MIRISNTEALTHLKAILAEEGIRAAISYVNSLTTHRFTSFFRFEGETLKNVFFFDRLHPETQTCEEIPVQASYCVFVRDSGAPFSTANSLDDRRVIAHVKRTSIQSYCGVPLLDRDGKMFGTICHFDLLPGVISNENVELLERMAGLLQPQL